MITLELNAEEFYQHAKSHCISHGFQREIDIVNQRRFDNQSPTDFLYAYVYVVLNAGMKNQVAEKIYEKYIHKGLNAIGHPGKKDAVEELENNFKTWYFKLKEIDSIQDKLDYLQTLPWIGKITKYHLARNLGIDVAKPDRHLVRLANHFNYDDPQSLCEYISTKTGDRVGVVDVVLWRFLNLNPTIAKRLDKELVVHELPCPKCGGKMRGKIGESYSCDHCEFTGMPNYTLYAWSK